MFWCSLGGFGDLKKFHLSKVHASIGDIGLMGLVLKSLKIGSFDCDAAIIHCVRGQLFMFLNNCPRKTYRKWIIAPWQSPIKKSYSPNPLKLHQNNRLRLTITNIGYAGGRRTYQERYNQIIKFNFSLTELVLTQIYFNLCQK